MLVGGFIPFQKYESIGMMIPNIWKNKTCSKTPTRLCLKVCIQTNIDGDSSFSSLGILHCQQIPKWNWKNKISQSTVRDFHLGMSTGCVPSTYPSLTPNHKSAMSQIKCVTSKSVFVAWFNFTLWINPNFSRSNPCFWLAISI